MSSEFETYEQELDRFLQLHNSSGINNQLVVQFVNGNDIMGLLDTTGMDVKEEALRVAQILSFRNVEKILFESLIFDIVKNGDLFTFLCYCKKYSSLMFAWEKLFQLAVKCRHMHIIRYILTQHEPSINLVQDKLLKICKADSEIFKLVLKYGSFDYVTVKQNYNRPWEHGCTFQTPFFVSAVKHRDKELLDLLLNDSRFSGHKDCYCYPWSKLFKTCFESGNYDMLQYILNDGRILPCESDVTSIVKLGNLDITILLLNNSSVELTSNVFKAALKNGHIEVATLIRNNERFNIDIVLCEAMKYEQVPLVRELLKHPCVNCAFIKNTLLPRAINSEKPKKMRKLLNTSLMKRRWCILKSAVWLIVHFHNIMMRRYEPNGHVAKELYKELENKRLKLK